MDTKWISLIGELEQIWTDIGESKEDKDRMFLELEREFMQVYQRKIEEASCARAHLHQSLAAKEAEVAALMAVLGEHSLQEKMEKSLSLKEELASVDPFLKDLRERKGERQKQFADIQSKIEKINAEITGFSHQYHSPTNAVRIEEDDLSIRKLSEHQSQLHRLQKEKSDRLQKVLECVNEVHSLCGLLEVDFGKTVDSVQPNLCNTDEGQSTNISDTTLEGLSQAILKLTSEKNIRTEKMREAAESLLELWNLMDTPEEERKHFRKVMCILGSPVGCSGVLSLETIMQVEAEVERLTNLKAKRMKEIVLRRRTELEEICRTAHIEPDMSTSPEKVSALIDSGIVDPSELLANVEMQITEAKEEFMIRKEIMERVNKWLTACEEENWLEDYDLDENRYSAGRGAHLNLKRAEKARAIVSKIPDIVDKLINKIFVWEKERSMPFLYDGVPLISMLDEYKFLRLQKEELQRRYRDQKKLQAAHWSKSSPKRSNNFNRKTNDSGFMTPTPRLVATPGLFMQRSYSGHSNGYLKDIRRLSSTQSNFVSISKEDTPSSFTSVTSSEPGSPPQEGF